MLVLSRSPGERILIGDDVVITIVRIGPNSVRVGVDAPSSVNIAREEIADQRPQSSTSEEFRTEDRGVSVE